jgi:UDP-glucose:(glucosyl)LPS alpha-1,2-glucosyltransferase|tara:strand:- start:981 stop:1943 length:963 start_codon:yes stop_codon:yes gene_type:complete
MSVVYKGEIVESELSVNSKGGTEMMRQRLVDNVDKSVLEKVAVHLSRPREVYSDVPNVLWCHDLAEDPENRILRDGGWNQFQHFVFVSSWQRDQYIVRYGMPYSKCSVISNAIETKYAPEKKDMETIRFVYHTTPHRGLELLVPVFEALCREFDNIHLDVYSGFGIYGWENRDEAYKSLYAAIEAHPQMTYHGVKSNEEVLAALKQSHIFLYPNIWKETSCIALIEAIKSQMICIHPNYGALPETASNATIMYDWNEDANTHANYCFAVTKQILNQMKTDENYFHGFTYSDRFNLARNTIPSFTTMFNTLLRNVGDVYQK